LAKLGPELLLPKEDLFQEDLLQNTLLTKSVRSVLQTGHTGFAQKTPKINRPKTKQTNSKRDETWTGGLLRQRTTRLPKIFLNGHCDQNRSDLFPKPVMPVSPRQTGKTAPAGQLSTLQHPISRFTQRIAAKLWGCLGHLMDNLSLKGIALKRS
jgi:hypothetical protein